MELSFYQKTGANGCQIFGRFGFLKSESEPNFGFPHMPTAADDIMMMTLMTLTSVEYADGVCR